MEWSLSGELVPTQNDGCPESCEVCLSVCPFCYSVLDQDSVAKSCFGGASEVEYDETIGYYRSCLCGYSAVSGQREKGASGGMATWFLASLLEQGKVDRVIAVGRGESPGRMFSCQVAETVEQVLDCSGSAYYPVEFSGVLKSIANDAAPLRYAVVALPCVAFSLRRAMAISPLLREKIILVASLVCGQLQNRFCSEYLALEADVSLADLETIEFRRKTPGQDPANFAHVARGRTHGEGRPLPYQNIPIHLWKYRYFTHNACNYCDDIFGETADVVFMDAWLSQFSTEWRGTSLVIARSQLAEQLLAEGAATGECKCESVSVETVKRSQQGVIYRKRNLLAARLYADEREGITHPRTRVTPSRKEYQHHFRFLALTRAIQKTSKSLWPRFRDNDDISGFKRAMVPLERKITAYERRENLKLFVKSLLGPVKRWLWHR
nr:Coenzyme F420 hydrogenase/dehydrogenase, beta subunit C-terminal domain [Geobacter sp. OR-1]